MRTRILQVGIALIALIAVAIGLALMNANAAVPVSAQAQPKGQAVYAPACGPDWVEVPNPDNFPGVVYLGAIAAASSNDVWTVGSAESRTLIEHWDGSTWSVVSNANPGSGSGIAAVSVLSNNDVWVVGSYFSGRTRTLIEHWDGSAWTIVPSPNVGTSDSSLSGVAVISSSDVWASGMYHPDGATKRTLIEHWDGTVWSIIPSPNVGEEGNSLIGITAISSSDAWAVGSAGDMPLTIHWDGSIWSVMPNPLLVGDELYGIDAASSNDVWAVGVKGGRVLSIHWDGSTWIIAPSPYAGLVSSFYSVDVVSNNEVWAVGYGFNIPPRPGFPVPLIAHWDGSTWSTMGSPSGGSDDHLSGVVEVPGGGVWIVGHDVHKGLILHYEPCPPTATPTPVLPRCLGERFTDVCPTDYFYQHVLALNDLGIVSGYDTSPPCGAPATIPCFKPYDSTTRGQVAKIVSRSAGFNEPVSGQIFEDVAPDHTFYEYIESMAARSIINGYPCGGAGEPCGGGNLPYFRPGDTVSRGQLSKMAALAFGYEEPVSGQTFEDVSLSSTFYEVIERLAMSGIINGYDCGNPEPCVPPDSRPYFRTGNPISRGQVAKIVNLARTQPTPTPTFTPTSTSTSTSSPSFTDTATPTSAPTNTATSVTFSPTVTLTPSMRDSH